jgi:hypothetical protein
MTGEPFMEPVKFGLECAANSSSDAFSSATMPVRAPFTPRSSSSSFKWIARASRFYVA